MREVNEHPRDAFLDTCLVFQKESCGCVRWMELKQQVLLRRREITVIVPSISIVLEQISNLSSVVDLQVRETCALT